MNKENQFEIERNEMSEIIARNFRLNDEKYDPSEFEWSAHCLQMEGYHKQREDGKYIRLEDLQQFPIRKDHYDEKHGSEHFVFGVESVIEYAENLPTYDIAPKSEWISVEERLPKELTHVIVCDEDGTVGEAFCYKEGRFEWMDSEELVFVTHWMPLPEAPKKGGASDGKTD